MDAELVIARVGDDLTQVKIGVSTPRPSADSVV
jgi:hypothetical protein